MSPTEDRARSTSPAVTAITRIGAVLDRVYLLGAWLAALLLITLCALVLYSIVARIFGLFAGGATDVAGYVMATSTFMALAYTFRTQGHIRVALLVHRLHGVRRRALELWCLGFLAAVSCYLAVYMIRLAYDSWAFGERSEGADAILIWIPQAPLALGSTLFAIAVAHTLIAAILDPETIDPERIHTESAPEP